MTNALTTELEALNMMLTAADEAPVQSASVSGQLPLSIAKSVLLDTSRVVQGMGWSFNTEFQFPLARNPAGEILLAPNVISVDVDDTHRVNAVQRGSRLYDRGNHTHTFTRDLTGTVVLFLAWDELPQPVRHYIAVRAARSFQVRMQAGDSVHAMTEADEQAALLALQSHEADAADANFLTDSYSVSSVLLGRQDPTLS